MFAQELGSIVGTVTDPSGAALPGVAMTVTNQSTGVVVRSTTTNAAGNYVAADLPPSVYSVKAEKTGFQSAVHNEIALEVHGTVRADLQLGSRLGHPGGHRHRPGGTLADRHGHRQPYDLG
ncbi:MAG TPA: carboxypeptidase-like regulatory domain-containing protein [Terriglobia bacterium]|nr:carboxypeptidase-like regulatory domain-containing protein [Terriglobia bacterium]